MDILDIKFFVEGFGSVSNRDLMEHYKLNHEIDECGNLYHPLSGRCVSNIMDYRNRFIKEMKTAKTRKEYQARRTAEQRECRHELVQQVYADLDAAFGEHAFINQTQPNVVFNELGLKIYVICGNTHRATFMHNEYETMELYDIIPWHKVSVDEKNKKQILCNGFRDSSELISCINCVVAALEKSYK